MLSIHEIYTNYGIPEHLQMHMLRVASCSKLIVDNWTGVPIRVNEMYRVLLLHDMGNIVKIPVDEVQDPIFQSIRAKYYSAFESDDHKVSQAIAVELGLSEYELDMMNRKIFINNEDVLACDSYEVKIGAYCDQRVAPDGVMSLLGRLNEAKERYKDKPGSSMNNPKTDLLIDCAARIEEQIMQYTSISPADINDGSVVQYIDFFRGYHI